MGGVKSENSVCPRPLLQFFSVFPVSSVYVSQVMLGYVRLSQFTSEGEDVELNNKTGTRQCRVNKCEKTPPCSIRVMITKTIVLYQFCCIQLLLT